MYMYVPEAEIANTPFIFDFFSYLLFTLPQFVSAVYSHLGQRLVERIYPDRSVPNAQIPGLFSEIVVVLLLLSSYPTMRTKTPEPQS